MEAPPPLFATLSVKLEADALNWRIRTKMDEILAV